MPRWRRSVGRADVTAGGQRRRHQSDRQERLYRAGFRHQPPRFLARLAARGEPRRSQ